MQVTVDSLEGLERRIKVVLPAERLEQRTHAQLQKMASQVKLKGFRQNKVPFSEIKKRFAGSVFQEVALEETKASLNEILTEKSLFPAATPNIQIETIEMGQPLSYVAEFEEYPVIKLIDFKTLQVDNLTTAIPDEQIDKYVEDLRLQNASWEDVTRPSKNGDTVVIDFTGTIDGKEFRGGSAKAARIELGKGTMLADFESQLVGVTTGQVLSVSLTFPENYHKELAGKQAVFNTVVLNVLEAKLPELDTLFIEKLGLKDIKELREKISASLKKQIDDVLKQKIKLQVIDKLTELHDISLPKIMVNQELERLSKQGAEQHHEHDENCDHDHDHDNTQVETADIQTAEHNVKQALLLREIMKVSNLVVDTHRVHEHIRGLAQAGQDPKLVLNWFLEDKKRYASIEAFILEEQIVEKILEQAELIERAVSYEEAKANI